MTQAGSIADFMQPAGDVADHATLAQVEPLLSSGAPAFFRDGPLWRGVVAALVTGHPRSRRLIDLPSVVVEPLTPDLDAAIEMRKLVGAALQFSPVVSDDVLVGVLDHRQLAFALHDESFRDSVEAISSVRMTMLGLLHDLANVVTVIQAETSDPRLTSAAEHTAELVQRMRALQLGYDLQVTEASLQQVAARCLPMLELQAGSNVALDVLPFSEPLVVRCIPGLVSRCLMNLVANAQDALHGTGRIEIRFGRPNGSASSAFVEVCDDGPGVPEELRSKIFERGFSTKIGEHLGLGLYALRRAARRAGGELLRVAQAGPTLGRPGATFRLELPTI